MSHPPNRLSRESSPYLLQHAHNPVDWYPWGPEAFEAARSRDVPIFLSIGYATCYWCHVMERESFENADIAALMNKHFVCIKVDREERPDVDDVFMAATVMMSGHGGWPMSVFVEPQHLRPFWCGTYFPAASMPGMGSRPTFPQVLSALSGAWKTQRAEIDEQAQQLAEAVANELGSPRPPAALNVNTVAGAIQALLKIFDRVNGGFSNAPKFPQPVFLELLMDVRERAGDDSTADAADEAVRRTLHAMSCGGLFDHVAGGFHRYSVDAHWTVPHFEKMLYDNAQLAAIYARAARFYGDRSFERTARRTLDFVRHSMAIGNGLFVSAIDAEVDGREGLNYLWTREQVTTVLGTQDGEFAARMYGLDQGPNFQDPHHPAEPASNVLRLAARPAQVAVELNMSEESLLERMDAINQKLLEARERRKQPRVDDKSVTAWTSMMVDAFSQAGASLEDDGYTECARTTADVLWSVAFRDGALARAWRDQRAHVHGVLEDYAGFMQALVRIARNDPKTRELALGRARQLWRQIQARFMEGPSRLYDVEAGRSDLFVRTRSMHDGAVPSGTSVLLHALLDLRELTGEEHFADAAIGIFRSISGNVGAVPLGSAHALRALLRLLVNDLARAELLDQGDAPLVSAQRTDVLQVFSVGDLIAIPVEQPVHTTLRVQVEAGWHIAAHDADGLMPLRITIENGTGVEVFADYPEGIAYGVVSVGTTRVLKGVFELPIVLERRGEWTGTPVLVVHYQACTDTGCALPSRLELDVTLERA